MPRESLATMIRQPLNILDKMKDYDISVNVKGGGLSGQAGAIIHGLARAIVQFESDLKPILSPAAKPFREASAVLTFA